MLLEVFVLSMCLSGHECRQTPQAYYLHNKDLQHFVKRTEQKAKEIVGPVIVNYVAPYAIAVGMMGAGQTARITLSKQWSLEGNAKEGRFAVGWTYTFE